MGLAISSQCPPLVAAAISAHFVMCLSKFANIESRVGFEPHTVCHSGASVLIITLTNDPGGPVSFILRHPYKVVHYERALSQIGTHPNMTLYVARMQNTNKQHPFF